MYYCYATAENRVPIEVVQQNRITRPRDKVFSTRAESSYLRRTDKGATSMHIEMDTMQYYRQAANIWRHALISSGNSRAAYMREYRKRKRLEEDNCNNASKWAKLHTERQLEYRGTYKLTCWIHAFSTLILGTKVPQIFSGLIYYYLSRSTIFISIAGVSDQNIAYDTTQLRH
jgi:hypothetical protein